MGHPSKAKPFRDRIVIDEPFYQHAEPREYLKFRRNVGVADE
jgi:hypothetical protein